MEAKSLLACHGQRCYLEKWLNYFIVDYPIVLYRLNGLYVVFAYILSVV